MNSQNHDMSFWAHLEELRWRLIKSIFAIIIGATITYHYGDIVIYYLVAPSQSLSVEMNMQVLKVTSMFKVKLSVALFGGIFIGLPIISYQFWRFVSPAFEGKNDFISFITILFSSLFFISLISSINIE